MIIDLGEYICDITLNEIIDNFGNSLAYYNL